RFVDVRDQSCRTPWCDAPIRHRDHIVPWDQGGPTTADNLQGLCEACNYTKELPAWRASPDADQPGRHLVTTTTPTGHQYQSSPPLPVGSVGRPDRPQARGPTTAAEARAGPTTTTDDSPFE